MGGEPLVEMGNRRYHLVPVLVAPVGIDSIVARIASIDTKYVGRGMLLLPGLPGHDRARYRRQLLPRHRSGQRLTLELRPQALRALIVEHQVALVELARHAESERLAAGLAAVDGGALDQRAEGHRERRSRHRVVDHLVPVENLDRVGARPPLDDHADHLVVGFEKRCVLGLDELRLAAQPESRPSPGRRRESRRAAPRDG